jgi:hypothetical protein
MPNVSLLRSFRLLHLTLGVVILVQSVQTVVAARRGEMHPGDRLHALLLGSLEAGAALLFVVPATMKAGATLLLVVFGAAFGLHAIRGEFASTLLVFAAGVYFVRVHGTVPFSAPPPSSEP